MKFAASGDYNCIVDEDSKHGFSKNYAPQRFRVRDNNVGRCERVYGGMSMGLQCTKELNAKAWPIIDSDPEN